MKTLVHEDAVGSSIPLDDLFSHLTQHVVSRSDAEIERQKGSLEQSKDQYESLKKDVRNKKVELQNYSKEKARLTSLSRVLSLIDTLNREGRLMGKTRGEISKILQVIQQYDFTKLRSLEERLSLLLPESYTLPRRT